MSSIKEKQSADYAKVAASYHEAGHIVCGIHKLICIEDVSLNDDGGGETNYHIYDIDDCQDATLIKNILLGEIFTIFGGLESEKVYYRDITGSTKLPQHLKVGSSIDNALGSDVIRKNSMAIPGKETADLKKKVRQEAEKFLMEHWSSVKSIAHALYKRKSLNFDDIKYILIRHPDHGSYWKEIYRKMRVIFESEKEPLEETVKALISPKI